MATTSFARAVLKDKAISGREYSLATQKVVACAKKQGVVLRIEDHYGLLYFSSTTLNSDALDSCEMGDLATIRNLYASVYQDPKNRGDVVVLECYARAGLLARGEIQHTSISAVLGRFKTATAADPGFVSADRCMYDPMARSSR
jgi:hypothetical protein